MWPFPASARVDLTHSKLDGLSWVPDKREASLQLVFQFVVAQAKSAIDWYVKAKGPKQRWARWLRVGAILAAAIAGIIPMLAQIFVQTESPNAGKPWFAPAWASVCLGLAATMVALDHFFGFSTAWMRFISAETDIRKMLDEYQLDWEAERVTWTGQPLTPDQVTRALTRAKTFLLAVDTIVQQETNAWIAEFQSTLRVLDDAVKAKAEIPQLGSVNVTVANGDACTAGWNLIVNSGSPRLCFGKMAALSDLAVKTHTIRVEGEIGGARKQAETAVVVSAGAIGKVELALN